MTVLRPYRDYLHGNRASICCVVNDLSGFCDREPLDSRMGRCKYTYCGAELRITLGSDKITDDSFLDQLRLQTQHGQLLCLVRQTIPSELEMLMLTCRAHGL